MHIAGSPTHACDQTMKNSMSRPAPVRSKPIRDAIGKDLFPIKDKIVVVRDQLQGNLDSHEARALLLEFCV